LSTAAAVFEEPGDPPAESRPTRTSPARADANRATLQLGQRPRTLSQVKLRRLARETARAAQAEPVEDLEPIERPVTRGDCVDGPRPCPWVSCKYHLYLDVDPEHGSLKINFPDREPWELRETCVLDVAEEKNKLGDVGVLLNVTRERIRQMETRALILLRELMPGALSAAAELAEVSTDGHTWPLPIDEDEE
jgi:hypothetical protein